MPKLREPKDSVDAVPQNFIPGYTKPIIHHSPNTEKKKLKSNFCYKGVPISIPHNNNNEKDSAVLAIGAMGLQALLLAAPSKHSKCDHICDGNSSPMHLLKTPSPTNNRRHRSTTYSTSEDFANDINESTLLPYKIIKKEIGDKKKWKSLENLHKITYTTKL